MGKLTVVRVNPSVVALQHHTLGPVGLLAVGTKEQPGTLVFYAQHPLWTMDTLRDVLAIMADCEVSTARAEEFRLATYEGKPTEGASTEDVSRDETVSPPGGGQKSRS